MLPNKSLYICIGTNLQLLPANSFIPASKKHINHFILPAKFLSLSLPLSLYIYIAKYSSTIPLKPLKCDIIIINDDVKNNGIHPQAYQTILNGNKLLVACARFLMVDFTALFNCLLVSCPTCILET